MSGWLRVALAIVIRVAGIALLLSAGVTNVYGTGTEWQANVGGWLPDGAQRDTFWDAPFVDIPGLSIYNVHCHGQMRVDLQLGATGPFHNNPCYAAMGMYSGGSSDTGVSLMLPRGFPRNYPHTLHPPPLTFPTHTLP